MAQELKTALSEFVRFAQTLRGDEKSEAQTFLDHFFRALGHDGVIEAGATFEFRVAKKPGSPQLELIKGNGARPKGGKKFADLLWPDRVLIEMKSRGENLEKHYDQVFDYWTHIVPKRPPFVILCNFDEFWIYDFNTQLFDPVDRIKIAELPENISALNFLLPIWKKPIFGNNWVDVTRRAADQMAAVFREIEPKRTASVDRPRKIGRTCVQRFYERYFRTAWTRRSATLSAPISRASSTSAKLSGQHAPARLTAAVRATYGMLADADPLAFLLELNLACAVKEKAGERITPPGLSLPQGECAAFVTEDCIQVPSA